VGPGEYHVEREPGGLAYSIPTGPRGSKASKEVTAGPGEYETADAVRTSPAWTVAGKPGAQVCGICPCPKRDLSLSKADSSDALMSPTAWSVWSVLAAVCHHAYTVQRSLNEVPSTSVSTNVMIAPWLRTSWSPCVHICCTMHQGHAVRAEPLHVLAPAHAGWRVHAVYAGPGPCGKPRETRILLQRGDIRPDPGQYEGMHAQNRFPEHERGPLFDRPAVEPLLAPPDRSLDAIVASFLGSAVPADTSTGKGTLQVLAPSSAAQKGKGRSQEKHAAKHTPYALTASNSAGASTNGVSGTPAGGILPLLFAHVCIQARNLRYGVPRVDLGQHYMLPPRAAPSPRTLFIDSSVQERARSRHRLSCSRPGMGNAISSESSSGRSRVALGVALSSHKCRHIHNHRCDC
jgi:hypothetical protein